jgi:hypothetical protein
MRTSPLPVRDDEPVAPVTADASPEPARRPAWPAVLLSVAAVGCLYTLLFTRNHRFAFIDDRQSDGVPKLIDMGRILLSGEWPWLSTHAINSGGYAVEYQNGVFNPVNLAFGILMGRMNDVALGSFLQLLFHLLLLTAAAAWLFRMLGLSTPWAVAFAVSVGFQPYTVYWGSSWYQAIVSFSWLVLAVAAAVALHLRGKQRYGWLLLVSIYLCCQSGWPLAIPVLGLFLVVLVVARIVTRQPRATTVWLGAWSVGGALVSLIGLYPLFLSFQVAGRSSSISNASNFNVAPLEGLLHAADPSYAGFFYNFDGYTLQNLPSFYVAWFVLPVLVFWRPVRGALRRPPVRAVVVAAVTLLCVSALGALGPERVLVFRFPTRFLQYSGFFLLLCVALLLANGRFTFSRRRLVVLGGVVALQVVNSLQEDPGALRRTIGLNAVVALLSLVLVAGYVPRPATDRLVRLTRMVPRRAPGAIVAVGTVAVMAALAYVHPAARGVDWGFPNDLRTVEALSQRDYTLWFGAGPPLTASGEVPSPAAAAGYYREYHPSSMGLMVGDRSVNGYSPLGDRYLQAHVPLDDQGNFGNTGAEKFTAIDPSTGLTWLELLRVDQIVADLGPRDDQVKGLLDDTWQRVSQGRYTATYRRASYDLPGLVSYAAPGVTVGTQEPCRLQNSHECVDVSVTGRQPGRVVFARLWFPGYSATVGGKPVDVVRHDGGLVEVDLPPGTHGTLVVSYRSPGFLPLAALAVAVLVGLAIAQFVVRRRARAAGPGHEPVTKGGAGQGGVENSGRQRVHDPRGPMRTRADRHAP